MSVLNIGIVGCGGMGGGHAVAIASGTGNTVWFPDSMKVLSFDSPLTTDISQKLALAGVYDISPDRQEWARKLGFHTYANYEEMLLDEHVDAILIATPNHLHKEEAIKAMRAGKHVLCEKPVTPTSQELLEILAVSKETGKVFYPRQNRRWDEDFLIVKKIYEEKLVGNVFDIECRVMGSRGIPGDWRGVKAYGGGMMLDWGVHIIDRVLMMIPEKVKKVFCACSHITNKECDDGFKLHLTFESGLTVVLEVGTCHFVNLPLWTVYGDYGSALIEDWSLKGCLMRLKSWNDRDTSPIMAGAGLTKTMAPRLENSAEELALPKVMFDPNELYSNFVEACHGEAEQIVTGEQALRVLKLMEAAFESDEKGAVVAFE